jgi:hypothetical protein
MVTVYSAVESSSRHGWTHRKFERQHAPTTSDVAVPAVTTEMMLNSVQYRAVQRLKQELHRNLCVVCSGCAGSGILSQIDRSRSRGTRRHVRFQSLQNSICCRSTVQRFFVRKRARQCKPRKGNFCRILSIASTVHPARPLWLQFRHSPHWSQLRVLPRLRLETTLRL